MFACLLDDLFLGSCYSNSTWETGGSELALTITFVFQANRLTKCASHPKKPTKKPSIVILFSISFERISPRMYNRIPSLSVSVKPNLMILRSHECETASLGMTNLA